MSTGNETDERDPYAPPPEGAPDRPPAAPWNAPGRQDTSDGGRPSRQDDAQARGHRPGSGHGRGDGQEPRQPVPDRRVRDARVALWCGVWGLFFPLALASDLGRVLGVVLGGAALMLGARVVRRVPATRPGPRVESGPGSTVHAAHVGHGAPAPGMVRRRVSRPAGAMIGLVAGVLALVWSVGVWGVQAANRDYYDCMDNALTKTAQDVCLKKLPDALHPVVDHI